MNGKDLGGDFTAASRRRTPMQQDRKDKVRKGTKQILKLGKATKEARRLYFTGVQPKAYGFSIQGCAPTTARELRVEAGKALQIRKQGGCLTTAMAVCGFAAKDPLLTYSFENILGLITGVQQNGPRTMGIINQYFAGVVEIMRPATRWARVRGPLTSCVATLFDWGWKPKSFTEWCAPDGMTWKLNYNSNDIGAVVKEVFTEHAKQTIWKDLAGRHWHGLGSEPDLMPAKSLIKHYTKKGMRRELYFTHAVVQGAMDDHVKIHFSCRESGERVCCKCGNVVEGSDWKHLSYFCPAVREICNSQNVSHSKRALCLFSS